MGSHKPHSYRGDYAHLSFTPAFSVLASEMRIDAEHAVGQKFCGWKGGSYTMTATSTVYLSPPGDTTDVEITEGLLAWMFEQVLPAPREDRIVDLAEAGIALIG